MQTNCTRWAMVHRSCRGETMATSLVLIPVESQCHLLKAYLFLAEITFFVTAVLVIRHLYLLSNMHLCNAGNVKGLTPFKKSYSLNSVMWCFCLKPVSLFTVVPPINLVIWWDDKLVCRAIGLNMLPERRHAMSPLVTVKSFLSCTLRRAHTVGFSH